MLIWAGALFADNDAEFLLGSALLMAPFGLLTAWLLGRLARWRALLWALGPPLVLYAFHNWDLPGGGLRGRRGLRGARLAHATGRWSTGPSVAAVLLGLGFAFKLYPGAFVLPLALYVLTAAPARHAGLARGAAGGRLAARHRGAGQPAVRARRLRGLAGRRSRSSSCARST